MRGRSARRRCVAGRGGADGRQLLHGNRTGRDRRPGAEQDRSSVGGARSRDRRNRGHHRHSRARCASLQRKDRRGRRRRARSRHLTDPAAEGRSGGAAFRTHHRLVVRQLRRRRDAGARDGRHAEGEGQDPSDGNRRHLRLRAGRRVYAEGGRPPVAVGRRGRLHHRRHQGNPRRESRRYGHPGGSASRRRRSRDSRT